MTANDSSLNLIAECIRLRVENKVLREEIAYLLALRSPDPADAFGEVDDIFEGIILNEEEEPVLHKELLQDDDDSSVHGRSDEQQRKGGRKRRRRSVVRGR